MTLSFNKLPTSLEECYQIIQESNQLVRHLMERIEKLEHENKELRARLNSNSNNSSKPPSTDFKKNKKFKKPSSGKSSGGQKGHKGYFRELMNTSEVDRIIQCNEFQTCDFCQGEVKPGDEFIRHQVHELPKLKLEVTEYQVAIGHCCGCKRKQIAPLPEGVSWGITGPHLTSFMSMMVTNYQLSRRNLKEFLETYFKFSISLGTIFNKQKLVNQLLKEPVDALLPVIKESLATHIDETSHREKGQSYWLWTFASKRAAYFKITQSRGKKVLHELMDTYEHVVISDRYVIYNYFDSSRRQICWAHLKRDFTRICQKEDKVVSRIGKALLACESQLFELWSQFKKSTLTREELIYRTEPIIKLTGEYLEQGSYTAPELKIARFCKNLLENFSSLWLFLERDSVEPTNNHAERCLRRWVIWRKKYFSTQSEYGSEYIARTASLITTARLQGRNVSEYLSLAIKSHFSNQKIPSFIEVAT